MTAFHDRYTERYVKPSESATAADLFFLTQVGTPHQRSAASGVLRKLRSGYISEDEAEHYYREIEQNPEGE